MVLRDISKKKDIIASIQEQNCKEIYMIYKIRLEETDEGFAVWVPGLPGCWSQGETEAEAIENIKDAIQTYLETIEILNQDKETRLVEVPV